MKKKPKLIVLLGPTASGKSSLALQVAKTIGGEIISADSRTIYRGMDIGTAKPVGRRRRAAEVDPEKIAEVGIHQARDLELTDLFVEKPLLVDGVPHWGIDIVNPDEPFTAADFKSYAESHIRTIEARGKIPLLVGGTGLYISAVVDNLSFTEAPENPVLREGLKTWSQEALETRLQAIDPEAYKTIDLANRRRVERAIEVVETTGKPLSAQQSKGEPLYDVLLLGLHVPREVLNERIDERVDEMIAGGLVNEVRALKEQYGAEGNAMTGIGYRQICAFLDGYLKLKDAIDLVKRDTRQYAKRQMTWFKRDDRIHWVHDEIEVMEKIDSFLKQKKR